MQLLPSQLNELYDLITRASKFSPNQFSKNDTGNELQLSGTEYYFRIYEASGYVNVLFVNFAPGKTLYKDGSGHIQWEEVKLHFRDWLKYLHREVTAPDKWGRLFDEMKYLETAKLSHDEYFSHDEYLDISEKFNIIKSSLAEIPLVKEQNEAIKNQLDHLLEQTNKLNKFDWQSLFLGTIVSVVIQLYVTPENAQLLYELIKRSFKGMFLK